MSLPHLAHLLCQILEIYPQISIILQSLVAVAQDLVTQVLVAVVEVLVVL
tara:strand:- start:383 stop:532 length:150 start_codon:yes stop_codon:yes gene_type:complete